MSDRPTPDGQPARQPTPGGLPRPRSRTLPLPRAKAAEDSRDQPWHRDFMQLEDLIERDGVRFGTRQFLESVRDQVERRQQPMTDRQRERVQGILDDLDARGWR